jgi:uncharacterized protein YecT (DUF1311 family)
VSPDQRYLSPDQIAYQKAVSDYKAQADVFRNAAKAALGADADRAKDALCPTAMTTLQMNDCVAQQNALTVASYDAFTAALRSLLALPQPTAPGVTYPVQGINGPQAMPVSSVAAFDASESAWKVYAKAECDAVDVHWRGGTIVSYYIGECALGHTRARMRELADLYRNDLRLP